MFTISINQISSKSFLKPMALVKLCYQIIIQKEKECVSNFAVKDTNIMFDPVILIPCYFVLLRIIEIGSHVSSTG